MDAIARLGEEGAKAGVMVESGGLLPSATGARIRVSGGKLSVFRAPMRASRAAVGLYNRWILRAE
jgi:hypothetical protein